MTTLEFTPKVYAFELVGPPEAPAVLTGLDRWLEDRGARKKGRLTTINDRIHILTASGYEPLENGNWVVLFAGQLHVVSPNGMRVWQGGS